MADTPFARLFPLKSGWERFRRRLWEGASGGQRYQPLDVSDVLRPQLLVELSLMVSWAFESPSCASFATSIHVR